MKYKNYNWIYHQFCELDRTITDIAKECNVSRFTIKYWVNKFNINKSKDVPINKIKQLYESGKTIKEIASILGCHRDTVSRKMKQNKIPIRSKSTITKNFWNDQDNREQMSESGKKAWLNEDYKNAQINIRRSAAYRYNASLKMKKVWQNQEYRSHMDKIYKSQDFRRKMAESYAKTPYVSNLQSILYSILDDLEIDYFREYEDRPNDPETIIGPYSFDCVIPRNAKPDLLIECQGEYWHKNNKNDKAKLTYVNTYFPNKYELKYLWEHEFAQQHKIIGLLKYWLNIDIETIEYKFDQLEVKKAKSNEYKPLLEKYHYLANAGRGGIAYGTYLDNQLIAIAVFSPLPRQNIGLNNKETRELSRLCIHPKYRKYNLGSWFISRAINMLPKQYKYIIAYCDTTFNHNGNIYKASGFKFDKTVKPDYWYVSSDGWVSHKKTVYNNAIKNKLTEAEYAKSKNLKKVNGFNKLRFIYTRN